jgi:hypothetical protein
LPSLRYLSLIAARPTVARAHTHAHTLYTLHTTHYTLHTTHYTLHTTHYTLHTHEQARTHEQTRHPSDLILADQLDKYRSVGHGQAYSTSTRGAVPTPLHPGSRTFKPPAKTSAQGFVTLLFSSPSCLGFVGEEEERVPSSWCVQDLAGNAGKRKETGG